jgi:hypothetical protein
MGSLVNSTKCLREKLYQFSTLSSRRWKQRKYFLAHFMRLALLQYPNPTNTLHYRKRKTINPYHSGTDATILNKKFANQINNCV